MDSSVLSKTFSWLEGALVYSNGIQYWASHCACTRLYGELVYYAARPTLINVLDRSFSCSWMRFFRTDVVRSAVSEIPRYFYANVCVWKMIVRRRSTRQLCASDEELKILTARSH